MEPDLTPPQTKLFLEKLSAELLEKEEGGKMAKRITMRLFMVFAAVGFSLVSLMIYSYCQHGNMPDGPCGVIFNFLSVIFRVSLAFSLLGLLATLVAKVRLTELRRIRDTILGVPEMPLFTTVQMAGRAVHSRVLFISGGCLAVSFCAVVVGLFKLSVYPDEGKYGQLIWEISWCIAWVFLAMLPLSFLFTVAAAIRIFQYSTGRLPNEHLPSGWKEGRGSDLSA